MEQKRRRSSVFIDLGNDCYTCGGVDLHLTDIILKSDIWLVSACIKCMQILHQINSSMRLLMILSYRVNQAVVVVAKQEKKKKKAAKPIMMPLLTSLTLHQSFDRRTHSVITSPSARSRRTFFLSLHQSTTDPVYTSRRQLYIDLPKCCVASIQKVGHHPCGRQLQSSLCGSLLNYQNTG